MALLSISSNIGNNTIPMNFPYMGNGIDRLGIGMGRRPNTYRQPTSAYNQNSSLNLTPRPYVDRNQHREFSYSQDGLFRTQYNNEFRKRNGISDDNRNYFPYSLNRQYPGGTYRNNVARRRRLQRFDYMNWL